MPTIFTGTVHGPFALDSSRQRNECLFVFDCLPLTASSSSRASSGPGRGITQPVTVDLRAFLISSGDHMVSTGTRAYATVPGARCFSDVSGHSKLICTWRLKRKGALLVAFSQFRRRKLSYSTIYFSVQGTRSMSSFMASIQSMIFFFGSLSPASTPLSRSLDESSSSLKAQPA